MNTRLRTSLKHRKDKYTELDQASASAIELISDVEALVESVRRLPWSFKAVKMKIAICKKNFIDSKELKRKDHSQIPQVRQRTPYHSPIP